MLHFIAYHLRMIARFCVANKLIIAVAIAFVAASTVFACEPMVTLAREIGVETSRADVLVSALMAGHGSTGLPATWTTTPLLVCILLSLLFRRVYSGNFALRWRIKRLVRAGQVLDAFALSLVAGTLVFISAVAHASFQKLGTTNFSDTHSLFSHYTQSALPQEPDQMVFLAIMFAYALLAVSTASQLFLLVRKALKSDVAALVLVFAFGTFRLYDGASVSGLFNQANLPLLDTMDPLKIFFSVGNVGYASWITPTAHGLAGMAGVLIALFAVNTFVPGRQGTLSHAVSTSL